MISEPTCSRYAAILSNYSRFVATMKGNQFFTHRLVVEEWIV